jgi:hypothetical protein
MPANHRVEHTQLAVSRNLLLHHTCLPCLRWAVDQLDQRAPSLVEWLLWAQGEISLGLHVITLGVNLGVIWVGGPPARCAAPSRACAAVETELAVRTREGARPRLACGERTVAA